MLINHLRHLVTHRVKNFNLFWLRERVFWSFYSEFPMSISVPSCMGAPPPPLPRERLVNWTYLFFLTVVPSKPPQFVEVTVLSSQSVSIKWKRPPYDSLHGRLQGYKVRYYKINDPDDVHEVRVGSTILNTTLRKLGKFTSYRVNVLAFTSKGDGVTSADVKVTTAEDSKWKISSKLR